MAARDLAPDRLVGLDVARCLALVGMVVTHVLDERARDGGVAVAHAVTAGRSAALFAVLAGVSLALMTGRREPVHGRERLARSAGLAVRALLVAAVGLYLGGLGSGLAVILTYYGLLFLLGLPFVGLRAPALFTLAGVWLVAAPVVSQWVRPDLPQRGFDSPVFSDLAHPAQLASELTFTGYYPVSTWLAYLLAGLAVGRLDLGSRTVAARLAVAGGALAVASYAVSVALTSRDEVAAALVAGPPVLALTPTGLRDTIATGLPGTTPTGGPWEWLLVVVPHSGTPFDLAHTIGTSLLVIGVCLLATHGLRTSSRRAVAIAFGAGTMTLSLYTLHVVMRSPVLLPEEDPGALGFHLVALLGLGALYVAGRRRGPLEWVVAASSDRTAAAVRGRPARVPERVASP